MPEYKIPEYISGCPVTVPVESLDISFHDVKIIKKDWGVERVIDNTSKYAGKILHYFKAGVKSSNHSHPVKQESLMVLSGRFNFYYFNGKGEKQCKFLSEGDVVRIPPFRFHQFEPLVDDSKLFECSTYDSPTDCVRIEPSQKI